MFYSVGMFRMSNPTNSISSNPERRALGRRREELGHIEVLQQRAGSLNMEILLLKKTRYFRLRNFVFFCVWEDARVWAHWNKIPFTFISAIRASTLCCPHPELPGCSPWGGAAVWRLPDWWYASSQVPQHSPAHTERLQSLTTGVSLFTDMAAGIPFFTTLCQS